MFEERQGKSEGGNGDDPQRPHSLHEPEKAFPGQKFCRTGDSQPIKSGLLEN